MHVGVLPALRTFFAALILAETQFWFLSSFDFERDSLEIITYVRENGE